MTTIPITTPQGFITQFNTFVSSQAMVPVVPVRFEAGDVIYTSHVGRTVAPITPLISVRENGIFVHSVKLDGNKGGRIGKTLESELDRLHEILSPMGFKFASESRSSRGPTVVRGKRPATGSAPKGSDGGAGLPFRKAPRRGHVDPLKPVYSSMSGVFLNLARGGDDCGEEVSNDIFAIARALRNNKKFTFSACFAELAAFMNVHRRYYSSAAADCWLRSFQEYSDPSTERFRISRGIYNAVRFPNVNVTEELFEVSAELYLGEERYSDAASDYLRSVWFYLNTDRDYPLPWSGLAETLEEVMRLWWKAAVGESLIDKTGEFISAAKTLAEAG